MGYYPQATTYPDGHTEDRTPWEDGWNAALTTLRERRHALARWWKVVNETQQTLLAEMLMSRAIEIDTDGTEIELCIRVNDTFFWGCADTEEISLDDIPNVFALWSAHKRDGLDAFVARRRGMHVIDQLRTPEYERAYSIAGVMGIIQKSEE